MNNHAIKKLTMVDGKLLPVSHVTSSHLISCSERSSGDETKCYVEPLGAHEVTANHPCTTTIPKGFEPIPKPIPKSPAT